MELAARSTAAHLQAAGHEVEVLTTCIRDFFADWGRNYHEPGVTREAGVAVRRFPVSAGNKEAFQEANRRILSGQVVSRAVEEAFAREMFACPALYQYIAEHAQEYIFFFIPYLYATTIYGVSICPERSVMIPCLHDEAYATMRLFEDVMARPRALVFLAQAEADLVQRLYGAQERQIRQVIGLGVETDFTADGARFRRKYGLDEPFLLYVGRRDAGKNTPLLLAHWTRFVRETGSGAKLVLIGPGDMALDESMAGHVLDLGYVSLQDKYDAYAAADCLCQPSVHESFSLVIMEAWLAETAVLVNGRCAVTVEHCRSSNGGLYFNGYEEFAATVQYLLEHPAMAHKMGQNGRRYVLENYRWPLVMEQYERLICEIDDAEQ